MVDVEQRALCAFEQNALALAALCVEQSPHRVDVRENLRRDLGELCAELVGGDFGLAQASAQRIVVGEDAIDLGLEARQVLQVHDADRASADLVLIGRPDAALGRADAASAGRGLAQSVELAVERKDQGRILGDAEIVAADGDAEFLDLGDLVGERPGIDHDAVADDRELALAHHARGEQRELIGGAVDHQRMAGIVAALKAHHDIGALRQPVDDLALALIAPLGADDHDIGQIRVPSTSLRKKPNGPAGIEGAVSPYSDLRREMRARLLAVFALSPLQDLCGNWRCDRWKDATCASCDTAQSNTARAWAFPHCLGVT